MKVFCIGLNKTGTTTFARVMRDLGFSHFSEQRAVLMKHVENDALEKVYEVTDKYDSFDDWPYFLIYKELTQKYPDAKFVMTIRANPATWIKSQKKHTVFQKTDNNYSEDYYGHRTPFGHEEEYKAYYLQHIDDVRAYFKSIGRPDDLLPICWENQHNTAKLIRFLGLPQSKVTAVPHMNRGSGWSIWRKNRYEQDLQNNVARIRDDLEKSGTPEDSTGLPELLERIEAEYLQTDKGQKEERT